MCEVIDLDNFRKQKYEELIQTMFNPTVYPSSDRSKQNLTRADLDNNTAKIIAENNKRIIEFIKNTRKLRK